MLGQFGVLALPVSSQSVGRVLSPNDRSQFSNFSRPRRLVALPWRSILRKLTGSAAGICKTLAHKLIDFREAIRLEQLSGEAQRASGHQASSFSSLSVGITSASSTSRS